MQDQIPVKELDAMAPVEVGELDLYQKREKIYTRQIQGFFQRIRLFTGWPLLLGYFLLPWFNWNGHQSVLFDLPARKFHILSLTFWPQDLVMLGWILIIAAFCLFFFTALFGRIWCGYSCPQTVWTSIYMWMEQKAEGSRNQRIKMDQTPWSLEKVARKFLKHGMWLGFAFLTGFAFVGYFTPIRELVVDLSSFSLHPWSTVWIIFFTGATYINAGWMREQVCMYMCPYARFQSAMFDKNTLIVSYDTQRGESRGSRKKGADYKKEGLGDCIDCQLCVQVCPTGIDIRNGLQYECIGCALCVDACNSVMDKMGYSPNLISYTTENHLLGTPEKFLRPRVIGYGVAILAMVSLFAYTLFNRIPLELDVIRDRTQLYVEASGGKIENSYTLKIMNMDNNPHTYTVSVGGLDKLQILGSASIEVEPGELAEVPIRLSADKSVLTKPTNQILFELNSEDLLLHAEQESRFIGPLPSRN